MGLFFKQRGHYVFDYKPIFYDPRKESREKRFKQIKNELGIKEEGDDNQKKDISFNFRDASISKKRKQRSSTIRLLVILTFLVMLAYFFLFTDIFQKLADLIHV